MQKEVHTVYQEDIKKLFSRFRSALKKRNYLSVALPRPEQKRWKQYAHSLLDFWQTILLNSDEPGNNPFYLHTEQNELIHETYSGPGIPDDLLFPFPESIKTAPLQKTAESMINAFLQSIKHFPTTSSATTTDEPKLKNNYTLKR